MKTRKKWVNDLLKKRGALESAIGVPIGAMLGCGHFGCVFRSAGPWVVKLTIDPTEGPIWETIQKKIAESEYGAYGFSRVKDIIRLRPDVGEGRKKHPLYAIVREDCEPLMTERNKWTSYTRRVLGIPPEWSDEQFNWGTLRAADWERARKEGTIDPALADRITEFLSTVNGIGKYLERGREARVLCHSARRYGSGTPHMMGVGTCSDAKEGAMRATNLMRGALGGYLGESLSMLMDNDIVLYDVHLGNVGWRVHERVVSERTQPGDENYPVCMVVYDPGHTPTEEHTEIEERFIANARWNG